MEFWHLLIFNFLYPCRFKSINTVAGKQNKITDGNIELINKYETIRKLGNGKTEGSNYKA